MNGTMVRASKIHYIPLLPENFYQQFIVYVHDTVKMSEWLIQTIFQAYYLLNGKNVGL